MATVAQHKDKQLFIDQKNLIWQFDEKNGTYVRKTGEGVGFCKVGDPHVKTFKPYEGTLETAQGNPRNMRMVNLKDWERLVEEANSVETEITAKFPIRKPWQHVEILIAEAGGELEFHKDKKNALTGIKMSWEQYDQVFNQLRQMADPKREQADLDKLNESVGIDPKTQPAREYVKKYEALVEQGASAGIDRARLTVLWGDAAEGNPAFDHSRLMKFEALISQELLPKEETSGNGVAQDSGAAGRDQMASLEHQHNDRNPAGDGAVENGEVANGTGNDAVLDRGVGGDARGGTVDAVVCDEAMTDVGIAALLGTDDERAIDWFRQQSQEYQEYVKALAPEDRDEELLESLPKFGPQTTATTSETAASAEPIAASTSPASPVMDAQAECQDATTDAIDFNAAIDQLISEFDQRGETIGERYLNKHVALVVLKVITDRGGVMQDIFDEFKSSLEFCMDNPEKGRRYLTEQYGLKLSDPHPAPEPQQQQHLIKTDDGIIRSEDGEVLNPETAFEALGILQKKQEFRITTEEEARWFIGKIRAEQLAVHDAVLQLMSIIYKRWSAVKFLWDWYGPQLRQFVEPQLPRVTRGENKGKLKAKNWKCIEGTVFFKSTGGWTVAEKDRTKEFIDNLVIHYGPDKSDQVRLADINRLIPQQYVEKYGIKLDVRYSRSKLYAAAERGEFIPGVQEIPKQELGIMGIGGGGDRSAWSLKKTIDGLKTSLKAIEQKTKSLAYGIDDEDEEEDAA